jgi:hypothetical protein
MIHGGYLFDFPGRAYELRYADVDAWYAATIAALTAFARFVEPVVVEDSSTGAASNDVGVAVVGGAVVGRCAVLTGAATSVVAVTPGGVAVVRSVEALTAEGSSESVEEHAAIAIAATMTMTNLLRRRRAPATQFTGTAMSAGIGVR